MVLIKVKSSLGRHRIQIGLFELIIIIIIFTFYPLFVNPEHTHISETLDRRESAIKFRGFLRLHYLTII